MPLLLAAPAAGVRRDHKTALGVLVGSLKLGFGQPRTKIWWLWRRIRFSCLLVHLSGGDLVGEVEEG
jgi:hypothetical protein